LANESCGLEAGMSSTRISYAPRPDATPESEVSALANVYKLVLDCRAKKEAAPESRPEDGTKVKEDSAYEHRST
jgi:hypothetical protein